MRIQNVVSLIVVIFSLSLCNAQSLIVGIPSADVAETNHIEITHETQWNFWEKPQKWNSFNFACFGLNKHTELTAVMNNLDNNSSKNIAFGLGIKKVIPFFGDKDVYERKLVLGTNVFYAPNHNNYGVWAYNLFSFRLPTTKTRFTAGISYGNAPLFGYTSKKIDGRWVESPNNKVVFIGGIEQPINKHLSFVSDWYSGNHDLAALIPALQYDLGHHVLIMGYKIPTATIQPGNHAFIFECMISLPAIKRKR